MVVGHVTSLRASATRAIRTRPQGHVAEPVTSCTSRRAAHGRSTDGICRGWPHAWRRWGRARGRELRLARLSTATTRLLELSAVAGPEFDLSAIARSGLIDEERFAAVREAIRHGMIERFPRHGSLAGSRTSWRAARRMTECPDCGGPSCTSGSQKPWSRRTRRREQWPGRARLSLRCGCAGARTAARDRVLAAGGSSASGHWRSTRPRPALPLRSNSASTICAGGRALTVNRAMGAANWIAHTLTSTAGRSGRAAATTMTDNPPRCSRRPPCWPIGSACRGRWPPPGRSEPEPRRRRSRPTICPSGRSTSCN